MKVTQVDDSQTTPETKMEAFLRMLDGVTPAATGVTACCPAHADTDPSLSVNIGESGLLLVSCFAGCTFADIAEAVGSNLSGTGWEWPAELRISTVGAATARTDHDLDALERYIDKCADTLTDKARAYAVERFGLTDAQIAALAPRLVTQRRQHLGRHRRILDSGRTSHGSIRRSCHAQGGWRTGTSTKRSQGALDWPERLRVVPSRAVRP